MTLHDQNCFADLKLCNLKLQNLTCRRKLNCSVLGFSDLRRAGAGMGVRLRCLFMVLWFFSQSDALSPDGVTLLSLQRHWSSLPSGWDPATAVPCKWGGVQCDGACQSVVSLNLTGYGISGQLGPEIAHLASLKTLDLSFNNFSGSIPSRLANCLSLEYLDLSGNGFSGELPGELGSLQNLTFLNLFQNSLSGIIPESLFMMRNLKALYLYRNNFSGLIPANVGNLSQIEVLWLRENQLSGPIPDSIGNCSLLQELYLGFNQLVGVLPPGLSTLQNLVYLDVSHNKLEGEMSFCDAENGRNLTFLDLSYNSFHGGVPSSIGNCSGLVELAIVHSDLAGAIPSSFRLLQKLSVLDLSENLLSGRIPLELGQCRSLKQLMLYTNQLEGEIPEELGMLSELQGLQLFENRLTGEIPKSIWKIAGLESVLVYRNNLSGELPLEISELKNLKNVSLYDNRFSGVIPQGLGINASLQQLDFTNNSFTGEIPPNICFQRQLRVLNLGQNQLNGSIPSDIGACVSLWRLILRKNSFTGPIPVFSRNGKFSYMDVSDNIISGPISLSLLRNCTNLTSINLSRNQLKGPIPLELSTLLDLQTLNISHNFLEGPLRSNFTDFCRLGEFDAGYNALTGSIPSSFTSCKGLSTLVLSENQLTGGIPSFLSELKFLSELRLGGNLLGGEIPPSIGALQNLIYSLNLSSNGLTGQIRPQLGNLVKLERLDISGNSLTGNLEALTAMLSLVEVNVSNNHFIGPIPNTLTNLVDSPSSSFSGNHGLCVNCQLANSWTCPGKSNVKSCDSLSRKKKRLTKLQVVVLALGAVCFAFVLTVMTFVFLFCRKRKKSLEISAEEGPSTLLGKVMEATENLSDLYIIGRGAHGVVYKVTLAPGNEFVVKKIPVAMRRGMQSLVKEIKTTGSVRHRNLVKMEDFWLRKDYGLILYRYMENRSLFEFLHERNPSPSLEWSIRYKIALGVAHGLEYLHFDCNPAIVHGDIKSGNILLDSELEPHISDFGVSKLLDHSPASSNTVHVVGTIGYIAPENAFTASRSRESDVYSYGVVLLELITRRKALDPSFVEATDIVAWVRSVWSYAEEINSIVDPDLKGELLDSSVRDQVIDVLLVALQCTEKEPGKRPTMRDVTRQLINAQVTETGTGTARENLSFKQH